jgi:hypothetical protein
VLKAFAQVELLDCERNSEDEDEGEPDDDA